MGSRSSKKNGHSTINILKRTLSDIGKNFSNGTDRLADICVKDQGKRKKAKLLKNETISLFKNLTSDTKRNIKHLSLKGILRDTSYTLGKFSRKTKDITVKITKKFL